MLGSNGKTPFEIMGSRAAPGQPSPPESEPDAWDEDDASPQPEAERPHTILKASPMGWGRQPLSFRMPRALACLVGLGVVLLFVLTFVMGRVTGHQAGVQEQKAEMARFNEENERNTDAALRGILSNALTGTSETAGGGNGVPAQGRIWGLSDPDPRVPGVNYCLLGYFSETDARSVAAHFAQLRFDVAIVPTENRGTQFFHVAIISAGIESGAVNFSSRRNEAEAAIKRYYGQYLKESGRSEANMRNDIMWKRYDG